ncbi:MAG: HEAT repeat domain-containing protein [Planctomycetia bacterium]|nr:HEAT repeat domain-containing protein [Planctomycetia bacterium]
MPPLPSAAAVAEQLKLLAEATGKERLALIDKWADQGPAAALVSGALAKLLADSDEATRIHAAKALGAIGLGAAPVVEALTAAIDPANPRVSAYVIYALGRIGEKAQAAFPKIAEQLTSPDQQVRREAVKAIRGMKLPLETAVPVLVNVLQTAKSPEVVLPALHAMSEVGKPGVPRLVEAMQKQPAARFWVCRILAEIGPDAAEAVPAVIEALGDERADVRQEAVLCLGHIGKPAAPAAKKILALLSDTDAGIRGAAVWALMMVGAPSAEVVAGVKPLLSDSDEMVRLVSAWSIAKLEPENAEQRRASLDLFIAALKQKNPRLRAAAARAIVDLKAGDPAAREALIETLADGDEAVSGIVSHALVEAGEEGVPLLVKGLERPEIRGFAAQTLGQVGPKAKAAVGPLTAALADENPHVRAAILFALGNIAPDDADVAERLIAALSDKSSDIRLAAVHALARNKAAAPIAKPVLEKLLTDPNPAVSAAAQFALDVGKAK